MNDLSITFKDFDKEHCIAIIKRGEKNLFLSFGMSNFEEEMEYWDMPTYLADVDGEKGFVFDSIVDKRLVEGEILRFSKHYDI